MEPSGAAVQQEDDVDHVSQSWKERPFARSFDLIAGEYGWTDDQILDLTLGRMRQIREVIWERQEQDRRRELRVREIELQTLASYIAASGGSKEGVRSASKIRLVPPLAGEKDVKMIPYEKARRMFGG